VSLPRLAEVRIAVSDLERAIEAWRASSGLGPSMPDGRREAILVVGDCVLRLVESDREEPGLSSLVLSVFDVAETVKELGDFAAVDVTAGIDARSSHGVPIQLIEGAS